MSFRNQNPADSLRLSLSANPDLRLSRNFRLSEFACKDGSDTVLIHPALILALQALRDVASPSVTIPALMNASQAVRGVVGAVVIINSGYRTPEYNRSIGGATNSLHTQGMAADIVIRGMTPIQVAAIANDLKLGGIKAYPTFTHIDVGVPRTW